MARPDVNVSKFIPSITNLSRLAKSLLQVDLYIVMIIMFMMVMIMRMRRRRRWMMMVMRLIDGQEHNYIIVVSKVVLIKKES